MGAEELERKASKLVSTGQARGCAKVAFWCLKVEGREERERGGWMNDCGCGEGRTTSGCTRPAAKGPKDDDENGWTLLLATGKGQRAKANQTTRAERVEWQIERRRKSMNHNERRDESKSKEESDPVQDPFYAFDGSCLSHSPLIEHISTVVPRVVLRDF